MAHSPAFRRLHPELEPRERRQALQRSSPPASVVHEAIRHEGLVELERAPAALGWSGLAAGLSMGFSLVVAGLLQSHLPAHEWRPLVAKLGYSVGFVIVILGRQQLFTENTLTPILPLLTRPDAPTFGKVARLWAIVLAANLVGALAFALAVAFLPVFEPPALVAFDEIASVSMGGTSLEHFVQGVFAGWLIALMIWMLPMSGANRVVVIVLLTYVIALGKLTHVVAGAVEVFYAVARGSSQAVDAARWIGATLAGNVLGGLALTAALNHAQVKAKSGGGG